LLVGASRWLLSCAGWTALSPPASGNAWHTRKVRHSTGDPIAQIVSGYRAMLEQLAGGQRQIPNLARPAVRDAFTRGHFVRAV